MNSTEQRTCQILFFLFSRGLLLAAMHSGFLVNRLDQSCKFDQECRETVSQRIRVVVPMQSQPTPVFELVLHVVSGPERGPRQNEQCAAVYLNPFAFSSASNWNSVTIDA